MSDSAITVGRKIIVHEFLLKNNIPINEATQKEALELFELGMKFAIRICNNYSDGHWHEARIIKGSEGWQEDSERKNTHLQSAVAASQVADRIRKALE